VLIVGLVAGCVRLGFEPPPDGGRHDDGVHDGDSDAQQDQMTTPYRVELTLASSDPVLQGTCRQIGLAVKDQDNQPATLAAPAQTLLAVDAAGAGLFTDPDCQSATSGLTLASQATIYFADKNASLARRVTVTATPAEAEVAPGTLVVTVRAPAVALAAGGGTTCAVAAAALQCWGANPTGELGDGTRTGRLTPTTAGLTGVSSLAVGPLHACAATQSGGLHCWGLNDVGQLGDGTKTARLVPTPPKTPADVTQVGVGTQHTCALSGSGVVRCWGSDWAGQLGNGASGNSATPVVVQGLAAVDQLSVGSDHNCGLRLSDGSIWCWGRNDAGQLGNGDKVDRQQPVKVAGLAGKAGAVAGGSAHTCAIVSGGLQCWGANWYGQLGSAGNAATAPRWVTGLGSGSGVTAVAAGLGHTCAVVKGELRCWGRNRHGQLGDGTLDDRSSPTIVSGVKNPTHLAAANDHTCAVADGVVLCWGRSDAGQLGRGQPLGSTAPLQVKGAGTVTDGAGGDGFTCTVGGGSVRCWGSNWSGQLGDGSKATRAIPKAVQSLGDGSDVACGENHACVVVAASGELWCWGSNSGGQLGSGSMNPSLSSAPVKVVGVPTSTQISSTYRHTCAVTSDGLWCWGRNSSGELGNGSTSNVSPSPTHVQSLAAPVTAAGPGWSHSCAAASGGLACWGANYDGQCATGATGGLLLTPQGVSLAGKIAAVTAGCEFSCAAVDQGAMCWGNNWVGTVGDGSFDRRVSPVAVQGLPSGVTDVAAGPGHVCALIAGAVWCWGGNTSGQLGDGSRTTSAHPVKVSGLPAASRIFVGHDHSCAVAGGQLWCWGSNALGELGEPWSGPVGPGPAAAWQVP
jgi:alpha-tubulin suppressor-like RCC1 family protein